MQTVTAIGLDIAKSVFQVHGVDAQGSVMVRRQLKRRYVLAFFVQCELVIGDDIGPALSRIEVRQPKRWNALHPEELGSFDAAVPGDDLIVITDQDRVGTMRSAASMKMLFDGSKTPGSRSKITAKTE
jgi:hypothetical protein